MALVVDLFAGPVPATWMDNTDDFKHQPIVGSDAADADRPDIWQYEGTWFKPSGVGPASEKGIDVSSGYSPEWVSTGAVFSDFGTVPLDGDGTPEHAGNGWNMSLGRTVSRHYIDADVKADAFYYPVVTIYTSASREGLGSGNRGILVGFWDEDGTDFKLDTFCGVRPGSDYDTSAGFPWADIIDKWVEFDTRWRCDTGTFGSPNNNGYVSVRMRTSPDGVTWTDLPGTTDGVVLETGQTEKIATPFFAAKSGAITYGMTYALGFDGMPGKCYYARLYDDDEAVPAGPVATTPDLPLDDSVPNQCCDHTGNSVAPGAGVGVEQFGRNWTPRVVTFGGVPFAADPPPGEDWVNS